MRRAVPFLMIGLFGALLLPRLMQSMAQGDVYPEWSTLRSDPRGAKVLYVALERMAPVSRLYERWQEAAPRRAAYVFLGASPLVLQDQKDIDRLLSGGGTLLLALAPAGPKSTLRTERLGFVSKSRGTVVLRSEDWRCLDGTREACRLAERGRVRMLVDGTPLRNGELLQARQTELLARLFGGELPVVFDESHLGVTESSGVGVLLRRYRLFPLIGLLLAAALLFLWRASVSLLPERDPVTPAMTPQPAASLRTLLAQHVPRGKLLETMVAEWKRALPLLPTWHRGRVEEMEAALERARAAKDPRQGYAELQAAIRPHKGSA